MKTVGIYRVLAVCIFGVCIAWLWAWLSAQWAIHVEFSFLFPTLYRVTGVNGPWMVGVGNVLFASASAIVIALVMTLLFRSMWWRLSVTFLVFFWVGQIAVSIFSGTSIAYLVMYYPLWLFIAVFALYSSVFARHWPNKTLESDTLKGGARLS